MSFFRRRPRKDGRKPLVCGFCYKREEEMERRVLAGVDCAICFDCISIAMICLATQNINDFEKSVAAARKHALAGVPTKT
jgi:hypothetical protein